MPVLITLTDENAFRWLLIIVAIIQAVVSLRYVGRAKAGSTFFRHREHASQ